MSYVCAYCERGEIDYLPATCPACGRYLTRPVSDREANQIREAYRSAARAERERATASKKGFFSWLKEIGFEYLIDKLIEWAWNAIKRLFGF